MGRGNDSSHHSSFSTNSNSITLPPAGLWEFEAKNGRLPAPNVAADTEAVAAEAVAANAAGSPSAMEVEGGAGSMEVEGGGAGPSARKVSHSDN